MKLLVMPIVMLFVAVSGCASYRIAGGIHDCPSVRNSLKKTYRIETIAFDVPLERNLIYGGSSAHPYSPPQHGANMDEDRIKHYIEDRFPAVFDAKQGTPISITLSAPRPETSGAWSILFPYLMSLGVLPCWMETETYARVTVSVSGKPEASCAVDYKGKCKASCFSPLGAIPYSKDCGMDVVETDEVVLNVSSVNGVLKQLNEKVFLRTLAAAVEKCLSEYEDKGL